MAMTALRNIGAGAEVGLLQCCMHAGRLDEVMSESHCQYIVTNI